MAIHAQARPVVGVVGAMTASPRIGLFPAKLDRAVWETEVAILVARN